jgi:hypothetical protein
MTKKSSVRVAFDNLIEKGVIGPNGQMRRNRKCELEPVYVTNPLLAGKFAHVILSNDCDKEQ